MPSSNSSPWYQRGNDDDLRRNPYARENEDLQSTSSSMYVDENSEGRRFDRDDRQGRDRYAQSSEQTSRKTTSSDFVGRTKELIGRSKPVVETAPQRTRRSENERERISSKQVSARYNRDYTGVDRPQNATRSTSGTSSSSSSPARRSNEKQKVKWNCSACTYCNNREFTITGESIVTLHCEMCSTPYRVKVKTRSSRNEKKSPEKNRIRKPQMATRKVSTGENTKATSTDSDDSSSNHDTSRPTYSMSELIKSLGADENSNLALPPGLQRRVQDFRFAQKQRREKHGNQRPWGIYGLYAHLSDIRADLEWAEEAAWRRHRGKPYLSWRDFDDSRDKGLHNRPIFTYAVMALCTIMMFVTLGVNGWRFEPLNVNPLIGPSSDTLLKCGARDTNLIVNEGQWYRLFTPMVLHAGLVHYFVNMLALYFIGGAVEKAHGAASAAVLFMVPSVGGNILSAICLPGFISVGASGGIFGLIGGCMADISLNWNLLFLKTTTDDDTRSRHFYVLLWLAADVIVNCLLGFTPFVDNFTHLGGFLYGFCIGSASLDRLASTFFGMRVAKESKCNRLKGTILRFFGLIVSIIAIMATTIVLVQSDGVTSPCSGCRYISCVPFPPNSDEKWWYCDDCDVVTADIFQSINGSGLYEQVNINCPNGDVEEIRIADEGIYDREELRRMLPSMCRSQCDEVFGK